MCMFRKDVGRGTGRDVRVGGQGEVGQGEVGQGEVGQGEVGQGEVCG